jgi:hypothetical protein
MDFTWESIERKTGEYDWSACDETFEKGVPLKTRPRSSCGNSWSTSKEDASVVDGFDAPRSVRIAGGRLLLEFTAQPRFVVLDKSMRPQ